MFSIPFSATYEVAPLLGYSDRSTAYPVSDMRTCTRCEIEKPFSDFPKQADCRDGIRPICRKCHGQELKAYRDANLEQERARDRRRYAEQETRRETQKATTRAYYAANSEARKAYMRARHAANPERQAALTAKRRAHLRGVEHAPYTRTEIFVRDGGRCRECRKELVNEPNGFHIDHIVPIALGGPDIPANVQLMCEPCNRRKWANLEGQIHLPV